MFTSMILKSFIYRHFQPPLTINTLLRSLLIKRNNNTYIIYIRCPTI